MGKLAVVMKRNGLSEAETARRLGVAQSALNRINYSGGTPTLTIAAKIVAGFAGQISYEDLLGVDAKRKAKKVKGLCIA